MTASTGTESMLASAMPVTRFMAPGPDVAMQTPVRGWGCGQGGAGYALGHKDRPLLMPRHDERQGLVLFHFIENGHDGAAGVSENKLHAVIDQRFEDQFRAFHI